VRHELSPEEEALALARARAAAGVEADAGTAAGRAVIAAQAAAQAASRGASEGEMRIAEAAAHAAAVEAATDAASASSSAAPARLADHPALASLKDVPLPAALADLEDGDSDSDVEEGEATSAAAFSSTTYADQRADPHLGVTGADMGFEDEDEEDAEDAEALEARAGDSFFVAARTDEDWSCAEVYCYSRADGDLYVHHDIALPAMPVALAWTDCPPARSPADAAVPAATAPVGSYLAVGSMKPGIEIWNLDVTDPLEPSIVLGGALGELRAFQRAATSAPDPAAARAGLAPGSHTDAVLALAWNRVHRQLLASGSADNTVRLWDIRRGVPLHTWRHHAAIVQAVAWHPTTGDQSSLLASASADRTAAIIDARVPDGAVLRLPLPGAAEALAWSPHNASILFATTDGGQLTAHDARRPDTPLFRHSVCRGELSAVTAAPRLPGILAVAGGDGVAHILDVSAGGASAASPGVVAAAPTDVIKKSLAVGPVFSAQWLPHADAVLAAAGGKGIVAIWDVPGDDTRAGAAVRERLLPLTSVPSLAVRPREDGQPVEMEGGVAAAAPAASAPTGGVLQGRKAREGDATAAAAASSSAAPGGGAAAAASRVAAARREAASMEAARAEAARADASSLGEILRGSTDRATATGTSSGGSKKKKGAKGKKGKRK